MRTVKQLVDIVTFLTSESRGRVNQMARRLMDDGLLPKSIGRDVKNVDSSAAFLPVFAIAFAKRAADASAVANKIADLPLLTTITGPDELDLLKDPIAKQIGIHAGLPLADVLGRFIASDTALECHLEITRGDDERYGAALKFAGEGDRYWSRLNFGHDHAQVGFTWQSFNMGPQGFNSMRTLFRANDPTDIPGFSDTASGGDGGGDG